MRFLYSLLLTITFVLLLPYFVVIGLLRGKYLSSVKERFGWISVSTNAPSIWVHAVSVGEFLAAKPLLLRITRDFPNIPLVISTTTATGQALAREMFPGAAFYFPFDWTWCIQKVLRRIRPQLILIMETEIWPNLLWEASKQNIPVILCNGRLSDRSFARYRWIRKFLPKFTECWMQSESDAKRMRELEGENVAVMGNLKFDLDPSQIEPGLALLLRNWKGSSLLWIAGSTMHSEEEQVIRTFSQLKDIHDLKLLIAPRHPERFEKVAQLLIEAGLPYARRSSGNCGSKSVLLLDSVGELAGSYQFADLVFVGGTIANTGGHNPIEPAIFGKAILSGPNYSNFRAIFEEFLRAGAIRITENLCDDAAGLLQNYSARKKMGESAKELVRKNAGAADFVMNRLRKYLYAGNPLEPDQELLVR